MRAAIASLLLLLAAAGAVSAARTVTLKAADLAENFDTNSQAPTSAELTAACPAEMETCLAAPKCATFVNDFQDTDRAAAANLVGADPPSEALTLLGCWKTTAAGDARRGRITDQMDRTRQVASDVKCNYCKMVVDDVWSMLRHRPESDKKDQHSLEDTVLEILANMCDERSSWSAQALGMFDLQLCKDATVRRLWAPQCNRPRRHYSSLRRSAS